MHFIVTRPEVDAGELTRRLETMGHRVTHAPLLEMRHTGVPLTFTGVQAVIATSRNALRALAAGPYLKDAIRLPLFVPGKASAALAASLGFTAVIAGDGGARELLPLIAETCRPDQGALLYLSGGQVAFDLEPVLASRGYDVRRQVVYESVAAEALPDAAVREIRAGAATGVILMSPRTAKVFVKLSDVYGLSEVAKQNLYICLSDAVAEALAGLGPEHVHIVSQPTQEEILALVKDLASNQP